MTDEGCTRLGLVSLLGRKCEETQAQLRALGKAVDDLGNVSKQSAIQIVSVPVRLKMG